MLPSNNTFARLADQVRSGDLNARVQFRQQMKRELIHIVRRSLADGRGASTLDRRILDEARRVAQADAFDVEALVHLVADRLCMSMLTNLRAAPRQKSAALDTVV